MPLIGITLQVLVNGYLLGKEYGSLVALRIPVNKTNMDRIILRKEFPGLLWMVPLVNFIAPVLLAVRFFTLRKKPDGED